MTNKPDNRKDNLERIQRNINMTIQNIELGREMIAETSDKKLKEALINKNKRRKIALEGMMDEIKDEVKHSKQDPQL